MTRGQPGLSKVITTRAVPTQIQRIRTSSVLVALTDAENYFAFRRRSHSAGADARIHSRTDHARRSRTHSGCGKSHSHDAADVSRSGARLGGSSRASEYCTSLRD